MPPKQFNGFAEITNFIWEVADLLRGDYKQSDYGKVILPMTVLRRLDCVLEPTKDGVIAKAKELEGGPIKNQAPVLNRVAGVNFYNTSPLTFEKLVDDPEHVARNLLSYIHGFSENTREIIERFKFEGQIPKLEESNLLYLIVQRFAEVDLHPDVVSNTVMGSIFEELIRRFSEQSNETAGEHFTPREVIRLMVDLLFTEDDEALSRRGIVRTLYDPACGTGGMLSVAEERLREHNPDALLEVFGQELNDESYAICKSDMLIKGQDPDRIARGNSFTEDGHPDGHFDYMLSNPPFGVSWKKVRKAVEEEAETKGYAGRFGAGTPAVNDGSFLFLQHMISKMRPEGSRIGIVFNASPLFKGGAGSGESSIRQWIIENDWLEAIVALPPELFYNTGINTYIWLVSNRKSGKRKGKVQLIDATDLFEKMPKSLGNKRNFISRLQIDEIVQIYGRFEKGERSRIFPNEEFGYHEITVEQPLRVNFQASPERIERLKDERAFQNLGRSRKKGERAQKEIAEGKAEQEKIREVLRSLDPEPVYKSRKEFRRILKAALKEEGVSPTASVRRAILSALSERDETAEMCRDKSGEPEPDTDLRDTERVPLGQDIDDYFANEVKPFLADAWIDDERTRVGYEIPLTRYFYDYAEPRPLKEIARDIRNLESRIRVSVEELLS